MNTVGYFTESDAIKRNNIIGSDLKISIPDAGVRHTPGVRLRFVRALYVAVRTPIKDLG